MLSLIPPSPPPLPLHDKLSLVVPFCSPAILSPKHQKMTINIPRPPLKPIVVFCTVSQNQMDGSDSSQLFLHRAKLILFFSITAVFGSTLPREKTWLDRSAFNPQNLPLGLVARSTEQEVRFRTYFREISPKMQSTPFKISRARTL